MINLIKFNPGCPLKIQEKWINLCLESESKEKAWIKELRSTGVAAAHPDDGWVNREKNEIYLAYPQFNDGLTIGSKIALGWPDKYRIVKVVGYRPGLFLNYWQFKESK